jgi:glycosyltransferase involved in cell wall biosynthesis
MVREHGRRILIDGTMARGGGGFTYLVNILPHLCAQSPGDQFRVLLRSERLAQSIAPAANLEIDLLPAVNWVQRMRFTYRELPRLAQQWGTDLYFSAGETAPLRAPFPMIASFRNPVPYAPDPSCSLRQRARLAMLRGISRVSARSCDRIMFVSEDSARWIGELLDVPAERRSVVHHGIDASAWARPANEVEPGYHAPYILSVSSIYPHKNYVRLIDAYAELGRRHDDMPDLVIIGDVQHPDYLEQMERARVAAGEELAPRIHILGEVPVRRDQDLLRRRRSVRLPVLPRDVRSSVARGDGERHADGRGRHRLLPRDRG